MTEKQWLFSNKAPKIEGKVVIVGTRMSKTRLMRTLIFRNIEKMKYFKSWSPFSDSRKKYTQIKIETKIGVFDFILN